ncbi:HAMP domain-containing histidine kinase [Calidifontibacter sp. DB0510]|uniref:histidine kinase n=1 Tax=Metallococcus carri TaxID=1656884 RepID=A0A967B4R5_9MICO|nr:HAMP domain-containing sensor histidine kinase [Metallococcus carri]NHN55602.1 HAMP domain-containing histidine kinase [Metallococcus carri]NOP38214.1 HAMP domain-containing histidine kinase [Calidifontibacter sp. DB2511S]
MPALAALAHRARRLRNASLRMRLAAVLVLLVMAAIGVTGVVATVQLRQFLMQRQLLELQAAKPQLVAAAIAEETHDRTSLPTAGAPNIVAGETYIVRLRGKSSPAQDYVMPQAAKDVPAWPPLSAQEARRLDGRTVIVKSVASDTRWMVVEGIDARSGTPYAVAASLERVDDIVKRLILVVGFAGASALALSAILGWYLVRRAFRPLTEIEDTARTIADGDLTRRIPEPDSQDEVSSLANSLNVMLGRIEDSFAVREESEERMRQFVADASHELRTPLATVRGYAELFRQGAVSKPEDIASAMRRVEDEAARMGQMVENLLLLTRLDPRIAADVPDADRPFQPVDLTVLAADTVQDARALAPDRSIRLLGTDGPVRPVMVAGDEPRLRQVLTNLVANAIRYTPAGSPIDLAVGRAGGSAVIDVRDHGPGVPEQLRTRIFERFFRSDASRNSSTGGSGLGLAIVEAIVSAHDGRVAVRETSGGGATFHLVMPLLTDEPPEDPQATHSDAQVIGQRHGID